MARRTIAGKRTIVTGASSGIGRALVVELARSGARIVAVARREARLMELAEDVRSLGGALEILAGDVTDAATRSNAIERAARVFGGLDLLVNNAGVGARGNFASSSPDRLRRIMEVNFFALAEMTRQALPLLERGTQPMVVNVSSVLGHRAVGRVSEYCASKFAVQGLSEALRAEFKTLGIDLLVVSPGSTDTEFSDHMLAADGAHAWPGRPQRSAESVARATVRAIARGRREIVPSLSGKCFCWLNRLSPAMMDRLLEWFG